MLLGKGDSQLVGMVAQMTKKDQEDDESWVLDSRASHNLTCDITKVREVVSFTSHKQLTIGNGSKLFIHNIGTSTITYLDQEMLLKNILRLLNSILIFLY